MAKWAAKLDEAIVIDDKGLRSLLKSETGPEDFCEALCLRFEEEVRRQLEAGVPLMVELSPMRRADPGHVLARKAKKIYGMTGGM